MSLYQFPRNAQVEEGIHRQSIPNLIRQLFAEFAELVQQHIQLTKTEIREEGQRLSKAAVFGIVTLMFSTVFLIFAGNLVVMLLLMNRMSVLASTLIVTGIFLVLAIVFGAMCFAQIKSAQATLKAGAGH